MSSGTRRTQPRPRPNPYSNFCLLNPSQSHPLSRKMQSMGEVSFQKSAGHTAVYTRSDSLSTRSNSTSGPACAAGVANFIIGLNPTPQIAPQLQPPPVSSLHLRSTVRGRVGGHPELLSLSQPHRGASPMSTGVVSHWRGVQVRQHLATGGTRCEALAHRQAHLLGTATRVCARYQRLPLRVLCRPRPRDPTGATLRAPPSSLLRALASSVHSNKGRQLRPQDNNNDSSNSPERRPPPKVKRTYFPGFSLFIPGVHLLTGRSSAMTDIPVRTWLYTS